MVIGECLYYQMRGAYAIDNSDSPHCYECTAFAWYIKMCPVQKDPPDPLYDPSYPVFDTSE